MKNSIFSVYVRHVGTAGNISWCGVSDRYGRSGLVTVRSLIMTSVLGTGEVHLRCTVVQCGAVHCTVLQPLSVSERLSSDRTASERFTIFSAPTKYFCGGSDLCERSACTCLATWAGWGSTRPPRPPTGPPASVCLSMLLLTLFSISTGRTTAFCRGFLADIHIE